jgi:hypothetical protein
MRHVNTVALGLFLLAAPASRTWADDSDAKAAARAEAAASRAESAATRAEAAADRMDAVSARLERLTEELERQETHPARKHKR